MEESQICPWCFNEIIWDEEIGPESRCPHCENELSGYRTLEIGLDSEEEREGDASVADRKSYQRLEESESGDWDEPEEEEEDLGFRGANLSMLAAESVIQRMIDEQEEAPECPACREYMLEAGVQELGGAGFKPTVHQAILKPIVTTPFVATLYICPSCFHTSSILSGRERQALLDRLASAAE